MSEKENIKDKYFTIAEKTRVEIKVKRSKFIATAVPAKSQVIAKEILGTIRTEFYDATHNCFAYRIGPEGLEFRASDDGEPSGSAGKPILFSIKKYNYSDLIVVVTRYYGGRKLGVGGLARAYSEAAELALEKCKKVAVNIITPVKVFCIYEDLNAVKKIISNMAISFTEDYGDAIQIIAEIPKSKVDIFSSLITDATSGRAGTVII